MDKVELQSLLTRFRDSGQFMVKGDALTFGAIVTLVSAVKLEQKQLFELAISFHWVLQVLAVLIAFCLVFDGMIVGVLGHTEPGRNLKTAKVVAAAHLVLIAVHVGAIAYVAGFVGGFLTAAAEHVGAP